MALTDTTTVMLALGIQPGPRTTPRYDLLRQQIEQAVITYIKWDLASATYIDYYDGNGYKDIILRRPWASAVLNLWLDPGGCYGDGVYPNGVLPFAADTLLTLGEDYAFVRDYAAPGNSGTSNPSKSGLVRRLVTTQSLWPSDWVLGGRQSGLSYRGASTWRVGYGNIKIQYTAGFTTIPDDIKLAVETGIAAAANSTKYGALVTGEGLGAYNWSGAISREPEFGSVRALLARYRDLGL